MNNKMFFVSMLVFITVIIICFILLKNDYLNFDKTNYNLPVKEYDFIENTEFNYHNTSVRTKDIEYIVIHYTGLPLKAIGFLDYFNRSQTMHSSADYFVEYDGTVYQYNMEIDSRYSWAVGDKLQNTNGGSLYEKVTNDNSINIEMCVDSLTILDANDSGWILTDETLESTILLVKRLMEKYNIPLENIVRHYDVSGKLCPGIIGWNLDSGTEEEWLKFKNSLN